MKFIQRIHQNIIPIVLSYTVVLLLLKMYEVIALSFTASFSVLSPLVALLHTFETIGLLYLLSFIVGSLVLRWSEKMVRFFSFVLCSIIVFIEIGLTEYFLAVHQLVDESLFYFSWEELVRTVGLGERFNIPTIIAFVCIFVLIRFIYKRFKAKTIHQSRGLWAVVVAGCASLLLLLLPNNTELPVIEQGVRSNHVGYFIKAILHQESVETGAVDPHSFAQLNDEFIGGKRESNAYPLFRAAKKADFFCSQFAKSRTGNPPNIVYIIVEGLSSDFVGKYAHLTGHMMPFLDSLSNKSLYYPNTLSTAQRTQGVLPSTLSSVPNAPDGIVFQQMEYPDHWSLPGLLKKTYRTRFSCGVPLEYVNMRGFMNQHHVADLDDNWLPSVQKRSESLKSPWGVPDDGLFEDFMASFSKPQKQPRLDILLTISTHDPYVYPDKKKWQRIATAKFRRAAPEFRKMLKKQAEKLGSYCYLDHSLRHLFTQLKKDPKWSETIVIITGDHGTECWNRSPMSKYHVPFIIYSPLLKKAQRFDHFVSHLDLTPTLLDFLHQSYGVPVPESNYFIGVPLSNQPQKRAFVFTTAQLKVADVMMDDIAFADQQLLQLDRDFNAKPLNNPTLQQTLLKQLKQMIQLSKYVLLQNRLLPTSNYEEWYTTVKWSPYFAKETLINDTIAFRKVKELLQLPKGLTQLKMAKVKLNLTFEGTDIIDSLPDLVIANAQMRWMDSKKAMYKLIRPVETVHQDQNKRTATYELTIHPKQVREWQQHPEAWLYFYNRFHCTSRLIHANLTIEKAN